MSIFGWSCCSGVPGDEQEICELCGNDVDTCICPECPVCAAQGDPFCYVEHGMIINEQQQESLAVNRKRWSEQDEEYYYEEY